MPRLVKARFYPNTEVAHVSDPEFGSEVSDNILDLQFALGIDADGDGGVEEGIEPGGVSAELPEGAIDKAEDEWLFNVAADVDDDGVAAEVEKWNPATAPRRSPTFASPPSPAPIAVTSSTSRRC